MAADRAAPIAASEDLRRLCWSYARRYPGGLREDLVQEGIFAVLIAERAGKVPDILAAYSIARRRMFNANRADIRYHRHLRRHAGRPRPGRDRAPGERADVPTYLAALIPSERLAVDLRLWAGLTSAEAANASGQTEKAVKASFYRAIVRLQRRFDPR
jgi:DNA-directed RNA polymerase specialized sigma24 family protein